MRQKVQMLKQELAAMKYKPHLSSEKVLIGHASVYLPVLHYLLLIYSDDVANHILESGYAKLNELNDYAFAKTVLGSGGVVARIFDLNPSFKVEEFLAPNCAIERKLNFILELITAVKAKDS